MEIFFTVHNRVASDITNLSGFTRCGTIKARFKRRTFHEPNLIRIKAYPNYLDRLN